MLHGIGIGIRRWLGLRRAGAFWLGMCVGGGAILLAVSRLRRMIHPEVGRVAAGPQ